MKPTLFLLFALFFIQTYAQVGIGTIAPDASAALHVQSTDTGILIPKLSDVNRVGITLPQNGLIIYNTTSNELQYNSNTPAVPIWLSCAVVQPSVKYSNLDIATDLNTASAIDLPIFGVMDWNDSGTLYSVSANTVTIASSGRYDIKVNVSLLRAIAANNRAAPEMRLNVVRGGALIAIGSYASTGYARRSNGHMESSLHINETVALVAGDVISVKIESTATVTEVNMRTAGSSNIYIKKIQ